ncbi:MAG: GHMP kinase [candidate division Zixibacteria bacterium]|nr:GHMP kinase [candidate division Zixibacteria bacterium]
MPLERISGSLHGLADVAEFEKAIGASPRCRYGSLSRFFEPSRPIFVVRAPARLDAMGGIADYSGAVVAQMPLDRAVVMAAQARTDRRIVLHSHGIDREGLMPDVSLPLSDLIPEHAPVDYERLWAYFAGTPATSWAAYVAGAFPVLCREGFVEQFAHGATLVMVSNVPLGAGVSSSAAIEVAAMQAVRLLYDIPLEPLDLARLAQIVENRIAGAPCGIMDQVASALGREGRLINLHCQPHTVREYLALPENFHLIGINSNVKHHVGGTQYASVRAGAFMGLSMILSFIRERHGSDYDPFRGYLCNISSVEYETAYRPLLPKEISGHTFLEKYGETTDPVTRIDPGTTYMVRSRVEHPIYEHERVESFISYLKSAHRTGLSQFSEMAGNLMYASDWSYTHRCGLGAPETAWIVREIKRLGPSSGFYGAKITGGGSGGTVAVAGDRRMFDHLEHLLVRYANTHGITAELFTGVSPGALEFGHLVYIKR